MKTELTVIGKWKRHLDVEVESVETEPFIEEAYRKYQKKIRVDGFRKGKVPLSVIRRRFGKDIGSEVSEDMINIYFRKAIEEKNLKAVMPGVVQNVKFDEGQPLRFTVEFEVEPDVEISHYKGIKVEKEIMKVSEEHIDQVIEILREQKGKMEVVKGGAESGDFIEGTVQALDVTGVPILGSKWENRILRLGIPPLGDLVDDQLLGVSEGEERRFKIVQPSSAQPQDREQHYSIQVKSVKKKILPELNDQFVQGLGDFKTVEDLRNKVRIQLEREQDEKADEHLHQRIADEVIRKNDFEMPQTLIENALGALWERFQKEDGKGKDEAQFREENRAKVIWNLKWDFLWHQIVKDEGLEVSEGELQSAIDKMAENEPQNAAKIRALFTESRRKNFKEHMLEVKAVQLIKDHAKIKESWIKPSEKNKPSFIIKP